MVHRIACVPICLLKSYLSPAVLDTSVTTAYGRPYLGPPFWEPNVLPPIELLPIVSCDRFVVPENLSQLYRNTLGHFTYAALKTTHGPVSRFPILRWLATLFRRVPRPGTPDCTVLTVVPAQRSDTVGDIFRMQHEPHHVPLQFTAQSPLELVINQGNSSPYTLHLHLTSHRGNPRRLKSFIFFAWSSG